MRFNLTNLMLLTFGMMLVGKMSGYYNPEWVMVAVPLIILGMIYAVKMAVRSATRKVKRVATRYAKQAAATTAKTYARTHGVPS